MKHNSIIVFEGLPFILLSLLLTLCAAFFGFYILASCLALLTLFILSFFRNPERRFTEESGMIVSPADGRVIKIEEVGLDQSIRGKYKKISIFMNVFNVHVNRAPCEGTIEAIQYHPGKFLSANLDKASAENERNEILIRTPEGHNVWVVQIAGLIARRIVCWITLREGVAKGQRIGLIRFGSRVEVFAPPESEITVRVGDKVRAGETKLGYLK